MVEKTYSMGLYGLEAFPVEVEADLSQGLPAFELVGLPDAAVKESRDRVRSALKNCGFEFPVSRITMNLAPADAGEAAVEAGPEALLELREEFGALCRQMDVSLSPLERRVLALYLSGYRRVEGAKRAGLPLRSYDNALHRVRSKLKRM